MRLIAHHFCHILLVRNKLQVSPTLNVGRKERYGSLKVILEFCVPQHPKGVKIILILTRLSKKAFIGQGLVKKTEDAP